MQQKSNFNCESNPKYLALCLATVFVVVSALLASCNNNSDSSGITFSSASRSATDGQTALVGGSSSEVPYLPTFLTSLDSNSETIGTCVIQNTTRYFTITINDRVSKSNCAQVCNSNVALFAGEAIACTFRGVSILGGSSFEKIGKQCQIVSDSNHVLLSDFLASQAECKTQCQTIGNLYQVDTDFACLYQNALLFLRSNATVQNIGACSINITIYPTSGTGSSTNVGSVVYGDATKGYVTQNLCDKMVAAVEKQYPTASLNPTPLPTATAALVTITPAP